MKRFNLLICVIFCSCLLFTTSFSVSTNKKSGIDQSPRDTNWKVKPLVRLNDPAPGTGGTFLELGESFFIETGVLVFWARFGEDRKDWAVYSLKDGQVKLVFKAYTELTDPDGVKKELVYKSRGFTPPLTTSLFSGAKMLYVTLGPNFANQSYVYGWDGEKLIRVIGKDDKLSLPGGREIVLDHAAVSYITNDGQALIYFQTAKPDKTKGWLLHNGVSISPLFVSGDELPGMPGIKIKTLMSSPDIYNDTILAKLEVNDAPYKEALFRITKNVSEKILAEGDPHPAFPDKTVVDIRGFSSSGPDHLVIDANSNKRIPITASSTWLSYSKGNWKTIISSSDDLQPPKGFAGYKIASPLFINPGQDYVILPVSLGKTDISTTTSGTSIYSYYVPYAIYLFDGKNLIPLAKDDMKVIISPGFLAQAKQVPGMRGAIIMLSPLEKTTYFDYNLANPILVPVPEIEINGNEKFALTSIIGSIGDNRFLVTSTITIEKKRSKEVQIAGFFELTKQ